MEQLQDITGLSIQKEGIELDPNECAGKFDFISDANSYVWVIEFERCEKPKEEM